MKLNKSNIDFIACRISPGDGLCIALPIDGAPGITIYIHAAADNWQLGGKPYAEVESLVKSVAANLTLNIPERR